MLDIGCDLMEDRGMRQPSKSHTLIAPSIEEIHGALVGRKLYPAGLRIRERPELTAFNFFKPRKARTLSRNKRRSVGDLTHRVGPHGSGGTSMSAVDRWGLKVVVARATKIDRGVVERTRDGILVRLEHEGKSWRQIGAILGLSHEGARKRWRSIPPDVRQHLREVAVG